MGTLRPAPGSPQRSRHRLNRSGLWSMDKKSSAGRRVWSRTDSIDLVSSSHRSRVYAQMITETSPTPGSTPAEDGDDSDPGDPEVVLLVGVKTAPPRGLEARTDGAGTTSPHRAGSRYPCPYCRLPRRDRAPPDTRLVRPSPTPMCPRRNTRLACGMGPFPVSRR